MSKIFLDPGHGGNDSGATANNLIEKDLNLFVAKEVKRLLNLYNVDVLMSREVDSYPSLKQRTDAANAYNADYYVSIHHNAGGADGYEVIYPDKSIKGKELAERIGKEFEAIGQNKRAIYSKTNTDGKDLFYVIRASNMPAVITEFAFIDSADKAMVDSPEKLKLEAKAIANGILKQLGIIPIDDNFINAVNKLVKNSIINSPSYWISNNTYNPEYVRKLIINYTKSNTFTNAVNELTNKNIINSPDYWLNNSNYKTEYVRMLILKLADNL